MQRLWAKAWRNAGLVATVSARALIMRLPIDRSLAQRGTSPQWKVSSRRVEPSRYTTNTSVVGAVLKLARCSSACSEVSSTSKYRAISSGGDEDTKRPHTAIRVRGRCDRGR